MLAKRGLMSEHLRLSSPLSSSPGRVTIARPEWPWSTRSYTNRNSQSSLHSSSSGPGSSLHNSWDPQPTTLTSGSPRPSSSTSTSWRSNTVSRNMPGSMVPALEDLTRQWTSVGLEWVIRDVHKLCDYVEGAEQSGDLSETDSLTPEQGDFNILKQSPMLGDKYKLEIVPTPPVEGTSIATSRQTLSLYITSLLMDFPHGNYETSASMMAAIKCQDDRPGERGARPEWVWEFWQNDWVFRQESEVWECPLPPISALLENSRIRETDSLVICIQIHSPDGPFVPQQPSTYYVPRDLLDGIEASLDNPNTGDVRFVCLEKMPIDASPRIDASNTMHSRHSTSSDSSHSPFSPQTTARKRVIYAHSDILTRRSEYFATMLSSTFSENPGFVTGERKVYTIVVEEADFETIYWLLKYCYANWLLFKEHDDPRVAVEGVGAGWSARWLNTRDGEWDWKTFHKTSPGDDNTGDARSVASGDSLPVNAVLSRSTSANHPAPAPPAAPSPASASGSRVSGPKANISSNASSSRQPSSSSSRRPPATASTGAPVTISVSGTSSVARSKPVAITVSNSNYSASAHYPVSPRSTRQQQSVSTPDPHPHPVPAPPPASALSMYQVAHRYAMPHLAALALEHMMATITPQSSFALLLATAVWNELHSIVEDYVIEKWDDVSVSDEFEQCCQEVAAGEWGPDGGRTLMTVFRRLRSPGITAS